jgi:hypothetical protein
MNIRGVLVGIGAFALVGCGAPLRSELKRDGLVATPMAYRVEFARSAPGHFVGADWDVVSHDQSGNPATRGDHGYDLSIDSDGDGERTLVAKGLQRYDLRLRNHVDGDVLAIATRVLDENDGGRDLAAWVRDYAASLSGGVYGWFTDKRLTSRIRTEGPRAVDGRPGYEAVIDIADVDRLLLTPGHIVATLHVVATLSPGHFVIPARRTSSSFPLLVTVSSLSATDRASKHDADLDALLGAMHWSTK